MSDSQQNENSQVAEVSKTVLKKEMLALQQLGEKIVALPEVLLKKIPLDEKIFDAIIAARQITKHGGRKRQLQYIGKLMRHLDAEPIQRAMDLLESGHQQNTQLFQLKERWREQLLIGEKGKLTEFFAQYPRTDLQRLRQLIRNHRNAKGDGKKQQASRLIFKVISEQVDQAKKV